jgi:hypothetical protein
MEDVLRDGGLYWPIPGPSKLTDKSLSGVDRTAYGQKDGGGWSVSRADVAHRFAGSTNPKQSSNRSTKRPFASGQVECSRAH